MKPDIVSERMRLEASHDESLAILGLSGHCWAKRRQPPKSRSLAGAVEPGLKPASLAFEKRMGHTVKIAFAPAPQIRTRIAGERWDVDRSARRIATNWSSSAGSRTNVSRSGG